MDYKKVYYELLASFADLAEEIQNNEIIKESDEKIAKIQ